jgi:hypothetical protein
MKLNTDESSKQSSTRRESKIGEFSADSKSERTSTDHTILVDFKKTVNFFQPVVEINLWGEELKEILRGQTFFVREDRWMNNFVRTFDPTVFDDQFFVFRDTSTKFRFKSTIRLTSSIFSGLLLELAMKEIKMTTFQLTLLSQKNTTGHPLIIIRSGSS